MPPGTRASCSWAWQPSKWRRATGRWSSSRWRHAWSRARASGHNRREHAQRLLAQRDLPAGQPRAALTRLDEVVAVEGDQHAGTQVLRAWAWLELGDPARANQVVAQAVKRAAEQRNRLDLCEALLVRGELERHSATRLRPARRLRRGWRWPTPWPAPTCSGLSDSRPHSRQSKWWRSRCLRGVDPRPNYWSGCGSWSWCGMLVVHLAQQVGAPAELYPRCSGPQARRG